MLSIVPLKSAKGLPPRSLAMVAYGPLHKRKRRHFPDPMIESDVAPFLVNRITDMPMLSMNE